MQVRRSLPSGLMSRFLVQVVPSLPTFRMWLLYAFAVRNDSRPGILTVNSGWDLLRALTARTENGVFDLLLLVSLQTVLVVVTPTGRIRATTPFDLLLATISFMFDISTVTVVKAVVKWRVVTSRLCPEPAVVIVAVDLLFLVLAVGWPSPTRR